jgi:hypothetical protein
MRLQIHRRQQLCCKLIQRTKPQFQKEAHQHRHLHRLFDLLQKNHPMHRQQQQGKLLNTEVKIVETKPSHSNTPLRQAKYSNAFDQCEEMLAFEPLCL